MMHEFWQGELELEARSSATHDDKGKKVEPKRRKGTKPIDERRVVRDCELGDRLQLTDGRIVTLTAWMARAPFGRYEVDGVEGELVELDASASIVRLSGCR